jgi:signal transduction histidine kinase
VQRLNRLRLRLFVWFLGAIVLAMVSGFSVAHFMRAEEGEGPTRIVSRAVAGHLARTWDDPRALDAYLATFRDTTGLEVRVRRDVAALPPSVRHAGHRGGTIALGPDGVAFIPVLKNGEVVGALEIVTAVQVPRFPQVFLGLLIAVLVLLFMAGRVSRRIARPLEQVAVAADRFGAGDLDARTGLASAPPRWISQEVGHVALAFDSMAERIARVVRDQRELLAAISHELRSPLGRARVALEIARDRQVEGSSLEHPRQRGEDRQLDVIERELGEVDTILGDLLAAARAGLSDVRTEDTALAAWTRERLAREKITPPPELVVDPEMAEVVVRVDKALLGRALSNLLGNALAHGHPEGEPLEVQLRAGDGGRVVLAVRDRGPGFAPDLLPRAFEPFVRGGDAARTPMATTGKSARGAGTGLGLALVRRIAEAHGGTAQAANVLESGRVVGAEVAVVLPSAPSPPGSR